MGSPPVIDIDALCRPISEDQPVGAHLRSNADLEKLWWDFSDKLESERAKEKRVLMGEDSSDTTPRWEPVIDAGQQILSTASKDMWVVAGMIEALARVHGFVGLRDGFRLARELTERFGGALLPPLDDEDAADTGIHTAFVRMDGIDSALPDVIRRIPIVNSPNDPLYSTFDHIRIQEGRGGDDTPARLETAARNTPAELFQALVDDVQMTLDELTKLGTVSDEACGTLEGRSLAPSSSQIAKTIADSLRRIRTLASDVGALTLSEGEETVAMTSAPQGAASRSGGGTSSDVINSREEAYKVLDKLAAFFDRSEPHSPMATALRELVSWRTLTFADLMKRLIEDDSARRELFRRTGVPEPKE